MVGYHDPFQQRSSELPCSCTTPSCVNSHKERVARDKRLHDILACVEHTRMSDTMLIDYAMDVILQYLSVAFCTQEVPNDVHILRIFKALETLNSVKNTFKQLENPEDAIGGHLLQKGVIAVSATPEAQAAFAKTNILDGAKFRKVSTASDDYAAAMLNVLFKHLLDK